MTGSLAKLKVLTLDCQATGANPDKGHLLEVGWLPTRANTADRLLHTNLQAYLVRLPPEAGVPRVVERITGIKAGLTETAISTKKVWRRLRATAQEITAGDPTAACPTVIHFARFERPFLKQLHQKNSPQEPFPFSIICTHEIALRLLPDLPRKGIRALAGYFGHATPELKRSGGHVVATAYIWKKMVELLSSTWGISAIDQLVSWLDETRPPGRSKRFFPMNPEIKHRLPNKPGVYRMLRTADGAPLYIGKAKSLQRRVNSYFRQKAPHAEHTLEMLTQARELDITQTGSALEAAILESDEIKRHCPPYNIALRRQQRTLVFCTKDLCRYCADTDRKFPVGPLPGGRFIKALTAFGLWMSEGLKVDTEDQIYTVNSFLDLPDGYAPQIDCVQQGANLFRKNYDSRVSQQSALRFLTTLGAKLWRERMETIALADIETEIENSNCDDEPEQKSSVEERVWTPEAIAHIIEGKVCHGAHMIRRTRWFCLLSESSLAWSSADHHDHNKKLIVFKSGSVLERKEIKAGGQIPIPPGYERSFQARQLDFNLMIYDRLRVLTTELRRLVSENRNIELRLGPKVTLGPEEVMRALRWV
jgi:DNA polymerase-3 subunit epsilon